MDFSVNTYCDIAKIEKDLNRGVKMSEYGTIKIKLDEQIKRQESARTS